MEREELMWKKVKQKIPQRKIKKIKLTQKIFVLGKFLRIIQSFAKL